MLKTRAGSTPSNRSFLASRRNWIAVVGLLLLATWLTVPHLNGAYWVDEVITEERAGAPLHGGPFSPAQIWEHTASTTYDQVPGYFWTIAAWNNTVGWSELTTRAFSLLVGLLAVAWTYRLGRSLHSPLAGLGAAAALVASALYIDFLHEGRAYALSVLLAALTLWLYWRAVNRPANRLTALLLIVSLAGLLYLHYFVSLLVFCICLYHLLFVPKNRAWWQVAFLLALAGALFLPWFLTEFDVVQGANSEAWRQDMSLTVPEALTNLLNVFSNSNVALLLLAAALAWGFRRAESRFIWFVALGPLALALVINAWLGMLITPKYLLYLWVPFSLLFGLGVARLAARGISPAFVLVPWVLVGAWTSLNWQEDPVKYIAWDVLHDQLIEQVQPDDAVAFHLSAGLWDGAHQRGLRHYFHDFPQIPTVLWSWPHVVDDVYLEDMDQIVEDHQRVWSAYDPAQRPPRITRFVSILGQHGFADCGRFARDPDMVVDLFARQPDNLPYHFGAGRYDTPLDFTLLGPVHEDTSGSLLVPLGWRLGDEVPLNTYSFAVHVLDFSGALMMQTDVGLPPDYLFNCQVVSLDTRTLPAGDYHLSLVVYAWETGERLQAVNVAGLSPGQRINLGTFTKAP